MTDAPTLSPAQLLERIHDLAGRANALAADNDPEARAAFLEDKAQLLARCDTDL